MIVIMCIYCLEWIFSGSFDCDYSNKQILSIVIFYESILLIFDILFFKRFYYFYF